jgi:hypothetical protein
MKMITGRTWSAKIVDSSSDALSATRRPNRNSMPTDRDGPPRDPRAVV